MGALWPANHPEEDVSATHQVAPSATTGVVIRSHARWYDALVWVLTLGRERALRERMLALAGVRAGESVLDVGCGTGSLAIVASKAVGATGTVCGIDASPEMIARAEGKARSASAPIHFRVAAVEALPYPDAHFDVVLSTLMLHHLPRDVREQGVREMRRVLKPGGRVLAVDFGRGASAEKRGLIAHFHRHGGFDLHRIVALLEEAGLRVVDSGAVGTNNLQFALATTR